MRKAYGTNRPLGYLQRHVLLVLSTRGASTITDWAAWYPFDDSQVRSVMESLGRRGLVDAAGFDGRARLYGLTHAGTEAVAEICGDDDPDVLLDIE